MAWPWNIVAIRGGTILTATRGTIPNGTIVLRNGTIAAVGAGIPIPPGADIVDATGRFVSPGLIDCHSHTAISGVAHYILLAALDVPYAPALAVWVGLVSQFIPTIGTYLAGALPMLIAVRTVAPASYFQYVQPVAASSE